MTRVDAMAGTGIRPVTDRPMYARALRLRHLNPGSVQCFLLFEVTIVLGGLLALAELVPWWGIVTLPAAVAAMVKINDMVAGTVARGRDRGPAGRGPARREPARRGPARRGPAAGRLYGAPTVPPDGTVLPDDHGRAGPVVGRASVPAPEPHSAGGWASGERGAGEPPMARPDENTTLGLAHSLNVLPVTGPVDSPQQRLRQSAARRYE